MNKTGTANYFRSDRLRGIPRSALKVIAILTMLLDHATVVFYGENMSVGRIIGRIAFPIFAFFIAEGALRSRSIPKYLLRLLLFALISEVPFDLAFENKPFYWEYQNVFFTLFFGLFAIWCARLLEERGLAFLSLLPLAAAALGAAALQTDYGAMGVVCVFLFYVFLQCPPEGKGAGIALTCLLLCIDIDFRVGLLPGEVWAVFALPLLYFYNGEKGRDINRYFYYGFYPCHLLILWALAKFVFRLF